MKSCEELVASQSDYYVYVPSMTAPYPVLKKLEAIYAMFANCSAFKKHMKMTPVEYRELEV